MALKRVYGKVDGMEVVLSHQEGDLWQIQIPTDRDGEYVVEIIAEDEAGNKAYITKILYTVKAGNICIHQLPLPKYVFQEIASGYEIIAETERKYSLELIAPRCKEAVS